MKKTKNQTISSVLVSPITRFVGVAGLLRFTRDPVADKRF
jgi:hypothetical protein